MTCDCAALLGLVNELVGASLIAPAAQELRPTAAATQWADAGGNQEVPPQAWASLGLALTPQVTPYSHPVMITVVALHTLCTHLFLPCTQSVVATAPAAVVTLHALCTEFPTLAPCTLAPHSCTLNKPASHTAGPHVSRHQRCSPVA